jgi:molybdopterin/thiamine biosynthesis adenylyltransferase
MSDLHRYSRQIVLPEIGVAGQQLLADAQVLLMGLGGLGSLAAAYLAAAGVGRLRLCDPDRLELTNLQRQILYRQGDLGRPKPEAAREQLRALNPEIEVEEVSAEAWPAAVREVDLVLDGTDNFAARFAINAACVAARKPLVFGAAIRYEGQVGLLHPAQSGGCYACLFPPTGEAAERCEEAGILGPVVGTIAAQQALLALRWLLGLGRDTGRAHVWDAQGLRWRSLSVPRDPACPVCARG